MDDSNLAQVDVPTIDLCIPPVAAAADAPSVEVATTSTDILSMTIASTFIDRVSQD